MILSPLPVEKFFDNNGRPLVGGKLFTYVAGTSTKQPTYTNSAGSQVNTNPIILNYRGEANVWLDPALTYKFVLADKDDTDPPARPIWSVDNIGQAVLTLTQAQFNALLITSPPYVLTPAEITVGLSSVYDPYKAEGDIRRYYVGTGDYSSAISTALAVSAVGGSPASAPEGTFMGTISYVTAGAAFQGQGSGLTIIRIPSASTADIVTGTVNNISLKGVKLDYTGGGAGTGNCATFTGCSGLVIDDIYTLSPKGHGLKVVDCPAHRITHVTADDCDDWAILLDGALTVGGYASNVRCINNANRGLMMRSVQNCLVYGVEGSDNGGTAVWMLDCLYSQVHGVSDQNDLLGDSAVIEGASIGCQIIGLTTKTCGGHGASISSSTAAPVNCHITDVYSDAQGESIAVISDQGSGFKPTNCSITQVSGKNCGRVTPSEGFGLANTVGCRISGSITDNIYSMTYAVKESGAAPTMNIFEVFTWVAGSSGYFSMGAQTSTILFPSGQAGIVHVGDANYTWNPGTDSRAIFYDTATLTAARTLTLGLSWSGDRVRVSRVSTGAFNLLVNQAPATLKKTLATGALSVDLTCDGTAWNVSSAGTL